MSGPYFAYLLPTGRCNLHCGGCYATLESFGRHSNFGELSIDEYVKVIDELVQMGVRTFDISGGEPLLYPALPEICRAIQSYEGTRIWLVTNGTVGGAKKIRSLDGLIDRIVFSLDAPEPILHDELRGLKGAFTRTMNTLRGARQMSFAEIAINFVVCHSNVNTIGNLLALAEREKVDRVALLTFRDVSENGVMYGLIPTLEDLRQGWYIVAEYLEQNTLPVMVDLVVPSFLFPESQEFRRSLSPKIRSRISIHHPHLRGHSAYRQTIVVKPFGALTGDTAMINTALFDMGSVRSGVRDVWTAESVKRRQWLAQREQALHEDAPCSKCSRWHYCRGGCTAAALNQWSNALKYDRSCDPFRENGDF